MLESSFWVWGIQSFLQLFYIIFEWFVIYPEITKKHFKVFHFVESEDDWNVFNMFLL